MAILDFLHVLGYLFAAAEQWWLYLVWMTAGWQGRVSEVLVEPQTGRIGLGNSEDGFVIYNGARSNQIGADSPNRHGQRRHRR